MVYYLVFDTICLVNITTVTWNPKFRRTIMSHWIYARSVFFQGRVFVRGKQETDAGSADILRAILARSTKEVAQIP